MTKEEKAKAYDEVREKIALRFGSNVAEEIFSEFEMNEDEKARREIKQLIQCMHDADPRKERWIAWLEKQGEQKPAWSEEDEDMIKSIYEGLQDVFDELGWSDFGQTPIDSIIDWLKSLKDRYT